jgi:hypothetical protein
MIGIEAPSGPHVEKDGVLHPPPDRRNALDRLRFVKLQGSMMRAWREAYLEVMFVPGEASVLSY